MNDELKNNVLESIKSELNTCSDQQIQEILAILGQSIQKALKPRSKPKKNTGSKKQATNSPPSK